MLAWHRIEQNRIDTSVTLGQRRKELKKRGCCNLIFVRGLKMMLYSNITYHSLSFIVNNLCIF